MRTEDLSASGGRAVFPASRGSAGRSPQAAANRFKQHIQTVALPDASAYPLSVQKEGPVQGGRVKDDAAYGPVTHEVVAQVSAESIGQLDVEHAEIEMLLESARFPAGVDMRDLVAMAFQEPYERRRKKRIVFEQQNAVRHDHPDR